MIGSLQRSSNVFTSRSTELGRYSDRVNYLNTWITGKSGPIESKDRGETMHLHCGDTTRIMRCLAHDLVLNSARPLSVL